MKELKLELLEAKEKEGRKIEIYKAGLYKVKAVDFGDGVVDVSVGSDREYNLPQITTLDDMEGRVLGFEVQTTSYGAVSVEEIRSLISRYEIAAEVAEVLNEKFANKPAKSNKN